jgi:hypothetical protein
MTMGLAKHIAVFILLFLFAASGISQVQLPAKEAKRKEKQKKINAIINQEEEGVTYFKKHFAEGMKLVNDGFGGWIEYAIMKKPRKSILFQLDVAERKHVKEEKLQNEFAPTAPVIFGKVNFFYPVKLGAQKQWVVGNKGNRNGVSISTNVGGGISLGLLRPYLVEVNKGNGVNEFVSYNSSDSVYFLNLSSIQGGPSMSQGWNKLKITPGLYLKSAVRFDYGRYNEMISAVEVGGFAEYYTRTIQQMVDIKQNQIFLGAYVSVIFGKRKK